MAKSNKKFFNWMQNNWMLNFDPKKTCTRIQFILAVLIGCYHFRHFCIQLLIGCKTIFASNYLIGCWDFCIQLFNWMPGLLHPINNWMQNHFASNYLIGCQDFCIQLFNWMHRQKWLIMPYPHPIKELDAKFSKK